MTEKYEFEAKYKIGDQVTIKGYGAEHFVIYSIESTYYKDCYSEGVAMMYDCSSLLTGEPMYADEIDIELKYRPPEVDYDEIAMYQENAETLMTEMAQEAINQAWGGEITESKPMDNSEDKRVKIDELLDELQDVDTLIAMFGEHEDEDRRDRRYVLMKAEIEAELLELTGGPRE